jgi:hypothetical protein
MKILPVTEIDVALSTDRILLVGGGVRVESTPVVHLGPPRRRFFGGTVRDVLGIGTPSPRGAVDCSMPLFGVAELPADLRDRRGHYLGVFMAKAVMTVIKGHLLMVKPLIRVAGVEKLGSALGPDPQGTVRKAMLAAGAKEVQFAEAGERWAGTG